MRVREVMTKQPTCCTPSCWCGPRFQLRGPVHAPMMKAADTGFVPVLER